MQFDAYVTSITNDFIAPKVIDTVLESNPLASIIFNDPIQWRGERYRVPFKYAKSQAGGSFSGYDTFDTTRYNTRENMYFDIHGVYQSLTMANMEQAVNQTPEGVLDLLEVEMESVQQDMADTLGDMLYGDGTGNFGKDFTGLAAAVDDGSVAPTYGGKSRSAFPTLQSSVTSSVGNLTLSVMATADNDATVGADSPNVIVTTEEIWSFYESLLQPTVVANYDAGGFDRMASGGSIERRGALKGEIGFDCLYFRGKPVIKDDHCPAGEMYFLNTKYIKWASCPHPNALRAGGAQGKNIEGYYSMEGDKNQIPVFNWTGLKTPVNQDAVIGQFIMYGELINKNPNRSSKLEDIVSV